MGGKGAKEDPGLHDTTSRCIRKNRKEAKLLAHTNLQTTKISCVRKKSGLFLYKFVKKGFLLQLHQYFKFHINELYGIDHTLRSFLRFFWDFFKTHAKSAVYPKITFELLILGNFYFCGIQSGIRPDHASLAPCCSSFKIFSQPFSPARRDCVRRIHLFSTHFDSRIFSLRVIKLFKDGPTCCN